MQAIFTFLLSLFFQNLTLGDLFAAGDGNWVYGEDPVAIAPWSHIRIADFSNNFLHLIDQTIVSFPILREFAPLQTHISFGNV